MRRRRALNARAFGSAIGLMREQNKRSMVTIGLDLGDRRHRFCALDKEGHVLKEEHSRRYSSVHRGSRSFAAIASSLRSIAFISARSSAVGSGILAMHTLTPDGWFHPCSCAALLTTSLSLAEAWTT